MLLRISLIVAILAALGAGTLGYLEVSKQIPALIAQRDDEKGLKDTALNQLATTNKILVKTQGQLVQTQQELADTHTKLDKAVAAVSVQQKRADELADKLNTTTGERDDARNQLAAYTTIGLTPEAVTKLNKQYKNSLAAIQVLNDEKLVLFRTITRLTNELAKYTGPDSDVKLRPDLRGKILAVDPKWSFVVLDVGEEQGIINGGELLVSREGKLVSKVIVRSVDKGRSIANVVPGWNFGSVLEGDQVSPAHPAPAS